MTQTRIQEINALADIFIAQYKEVLQEAGETPSAEHFKSLLDYAVDNDPGKMTPAMAIWLNRRYQETQNN